MHYLSDDGVQARYAALCAVSGGNTRSKRGRAARHGTTHYAYDQRQPQELKH
jgi:hypothetical protein